MKYLLIFFQLSMFSSLVLSQETIFLQALSEGESQIHLISADNTDAFDLRMNNDGVLRFLANATTDVLTIDDESGYVGIGTGSPDEPLSFSNTLGPKINLFDATGIYGFGMAPAELQIGTFDDTKHISLGHFSGISKTFVQWMFIDGGAKPLSMASGAHVTSGGVWMNASSRSLKENISDLALDDAVLALMDLDPVRYNYKAQQSEEYVGFIAEDVPALLATEDRTGLSPMDIIAVLTKVVQDQQLRISELERRFDTK